MARPSKPTAVIKAEGRSHRTKAELRRREQGEAAVLSGKRCFERSSVKADAVAHAEYNRLIALMRAIGKDDALYAPEYNRYCELYSEEEFYKGQMAQLRDELAALSNLSRHIVDLVSNLSFEYVDSESVTKLIEENNELLKQRNALMKQMSVLDTKIKQKREAMFAIEKENCMTVSAALRTIPKEAEKKEDDPLMKLLAEEM